MQLQIRVYGPLRSHMPQRFPFDIAEPISATALIERLAENYPPAAATLKRCRIAEGDVMLDSEALLSGEAEIALLPPSSGG